MNCPECHEVLKDDARFCSNCGLSFASFNTPTEPPNLPSEDKTLIHSDPLIGHILDSKYELVALLGEGGMGAVYRARRILIGDEVAVKVLLKKFVADAEAVERFRREARAAAMLRHPNVVTIHDFGEARGNDAPAYIVMELVEGVSLRDLLRREGRLEVKQAVALIRDICAGVGAAHRREIWHRDLKPDNVIVLAPDEDRERESVKVVDFGIAKLRDMAGAPTLTQTGAVMGTPYYMSPEQCRGEPLDARSDVYSLGAMLYEMLAGIPPFMAINSTAVIAKHLMDAPPPLPDSSKVPQAIEAMIMRALSKSPDARPQNASTFSRELQSELTKADEAIVRPKTKARITPPVPTEKAIPPADPLDEKSRDPLGRLASPGDTIAANPISLFGFGLAHGETTPANPDSGRSPFVWAVVAMGLILIGVIVWMTRSGAENKQAAVGDQTGQQPTAKGSEETPPDGMVYIPGGEFMMGRNKSDGGDEYEHPAHRVAVRPFFIDGHEVTCGEYLKFLNADPRATLRAGSMCNGSEDSQDLPVTSVNWDEANAYAKWAGKRLPTEEEWEFAARGTDGRRYPWGNDWRLGLANANGASTTFEKSGEHLGASPFGAFDMVGNAWEWTASDMAAYPGGKLSEQPPRDTKVLRGNSFESTKDQATTTYRFGWRARGEASYTMTGFRCVKDIGATGPEK